ncbi:MAG: phage portal protein, partial [Bacteroidetes bacterium]|nr:phage portal protein [Bacteroidota bacterium]
MNDLRIVNLSTYTSPEIIETSNKEWVSYGANNAYFQYLIDRYNGSPTNNAIINGISQMIYGRGLDALNSNKKPAQYAQMISLLKKDMVRKVCYDLKLMGQCAMQVIYSKDRKTIAQVEHIPVENLRAEKCNDKGEIEAYYYSDNWSKVKNVGSTLRIPAYGFSKENIEIMYVKPYRAGYKYYSSPDYAGGLQYAELEQEISNYHLNNILNGLAPSMLINFNNGTPNAEERQMLENRIYEKFSGSSNAGKFILAFNDNPESAATIEPIQLSEAHLQYQFLSDESSKKVMVSHRVVSPMLLGIKDSSGLGNNAEELETASILMENTVIQPFQTLLIDAFDTILAYNQISLKLYFKTLQPLQFKDLENVMDSETMEEETGVKLSEQLPEDLGEEILSKLIDLGESEEDLLAEYDLEHEAEVDYELEDQLDEVITDLNTEDDSTVLSKIWNFVSTGKATPYRESEQDGTSKQDSQEGVEFLVRYKYTRRVKSSKTGESRKFCDKMTDANKVYRKEDIIAMDNIAVNAGFGVGGSATYSIWKYKGGGRCQHAWIRKNFSRKGGKGIGKAITTSSARSKGVKAPVNNKEVPVATANMQYDGYTAEYRNKMGFKH